MLTKESDCGSGNVLMSKDLKYITVKPGLACFVDAWTHFVVIVKVL
jgi:hypothetical protein